MLTRWVRNILFVADRDALVDQAMTAGFKKFLPDEPCDRIFTWKKVSNKDTLRKQWQEIWDQCYKDESGQINTDTYQLALPME